MNVGDVVRVKDANEDAFIGYIGRVVKINDSGVLPILVEFDDIRDISWWCHDNNEPEKYPRKNVYWMNEKQLEIIETELDYEHNELNIEEIIKMFNVYAKAIKPNGLTKKFLENIKGDNDMRILEIYEDRMRKQLNEERGKELVKIEKEDDILKIWHDCMDAMCKIYEEQKLVTPLISRPHPTKKTEEKIEKLNKKYSTKHNELDDKVREVSAQLDMCTTYEQKQSILKLYKILKEDGTINA